MGKRSRKKMGILTVNLKHLYQRRGLWLAYVFLGFLVFASIAEALDKRAGRGDFIIPVMGALFVGFLVAVLQIEVLNKPFSYCLPGHRKVPRKFIFSTGVAINLTASLIFLLYPFLYLYWPHRIAVICSAFFAGLVFYWLGVLFAFGVRNSWAWIGFLPLFIVGGGFFGLHIIIERAIVENPIGITLLGAFSTIAAWLWLGNVGLARRYCGVPWVGFFDAWNRDKLRKYKQIRANIKWDKLKKHPKPWVERFFLGRMNKCDYLGTGRYVWGGLYTTFGLLLSQWQGNIIFVLFMVFFLGYMERMWFLMLFPLIGIAGYIHSPVYSSMLFSGGRRERFATVITLAATTAVLGGVLFIILAALSVPLAVIIPDIIVRGITIAFHTITIKLFYAPLVFVPFAFTINLIFYRKPIFIILSVMLLFMLLFFFSAIVWLNQLSTIINPVSVLSALVLSWGIFVLVLRYICTRRCLVGQGRTY